MRRVKIFIEGRSQLEKTINKWIDEKKPQIISVSGTGEERYPTTYVLYEDHESDPLVEPEICLSLE